MNGQPIGADAPVVGTCVHPHIGISLVYEMDLCIDVENKTPRYLGTGDAGAIYTGVITYECQDCGYKAKHREKAAPKWLMQYVDTVTEIKGYEGRRVREEYDLS